MKIRKGFVSNSSSTSFIIRGVKLEIGEVADRLNIDPTQDNLFKAIYNEFGYGREKVQCESASDFFDGEDYNKTDVIVGMHFASLDDGVVVEVEDPDDTAIRAKIEEKIGKVGDLKTYIQFVSNDNY